MTGDGWRQNIAKCEVVKYAGSIRAEDSIDHIDFNWVKLPR